MVTGNSGGACVTAVAEGAGFGDGWRLARLVSTVPLAPGLEKKPRRSGIPVVLCRVRRDQCP